MSRPPLPQPNVRFLDTENRVTRDWYDWFRTLVQAAEEGDILAVSFQEGAWTPTFTFVSPGDLNVSSYVANRRNGTYVRIGNLVWVSYVMFATFTHTTGGSNVIITGMPFTAASDLSHYLGPCSAEGMGNAGGGQTQIQTLIRSGSNQIGFQMSGYNPGFLNVLLASMTPSGSFNCMGSVMFKAA